jgi:exopolysaccharide biosynthesis polyprenyl glycosylphosphotransferase
MASNATLKAVPFAAPQTAAAASAQASTSAMASDFAAVRALSLFLADLVAGVVGMMAAYYVRFYVMPAPLGHDPGDYVMIFPVAVLLWIMARFFSGLNRFRQRAFDLRVARRAAKASILATLMIMSAGFYTHVDYSRKLPPLIFVSLLATTCALRWLAETQFDRLRRTRGLGLSRVAIVGVSQTGSTMAAKIRQDLTAGRRAVGFLRAPGNQAGPDSELLGGLPLLGSVERLAELAREHDLHEIIVADPMMAPQDILEFLLECEKHCLRASVVPNILETFVTDIHLDEIGGLPLFGFRGTRLNGGNLALKRAFDMSVAAAMLVALSPILLLVAIAVKLTSRGPLMYKQERVTLYGSSFDMYKFRTMRIDAEEKSGPVWTKENDPRVTGIGKWLRKLNLDELPQLINVLKGDMSLVGPRPERPCFVDQFKHDVPHYMARLKCKAGMTGWAQVNGMRGNTSITERVKYDLDYLENWSIWFDIKILFRTLRAHKNAY